MRMAGMAAIAVNNGYEYAPWANMLYACDARWWREYSSRGVCGGAGWVSFAGIKVTLEPPIDTAIHRVGNGGPWGFDPRPDHVRTGKNSGCQAAHIAAHAGARRILLLGCDCRNDGARAHEFGEHRWFSGKVPDFRDMGSFIKGWQALATELAARGVEVINCSPHSAIDCFPKMTVQDALTMSIT